MPTNLAIILTTLSPGWTRQYTHCAKKTILLYWQEKVSHKFSLKDQKPSERRLFQDQLYLQCTTLEEEDQNKAEFNKDFW